MSTCKKHTIIGMAGHIDHGKTELIRAMTGLETDRLKEEKERGITIDLGFAYWKDDVTIIDVPGHEKFIRNMVTGVNAVDLFLLVIAADDGIMPQTREHFEILSFFGIKNGVIALNKIDLVDKEWRDLVKNDIEDFLRSNGLKDIPIIEVSARTGEGIELLRDTLTREIEKVEPRNDHSPFRMNIDRSFNLKGHGTVITGTILSSSVKVGDSIQILPELLDSKVRAIQVHQKDLPLASIGQRAAINIANISPKESSRGKAIIHPDTLLPSQTLLIEIKTVNEMPFSIKKHANVHVHLGTFETVGKITWYRAEKELQEKQNYVVFVKLSQEAAAAVGDPVLIRSFSPVITIAGGRVLQVNPPRIKKDPDISGKYYDALINGTLTEKITAMVEQGGYRYYTMNDFVKMLFIKEEIMLKTIEKMVKNKKIISREMNNETIFLSIEKIKSMIQTIASRMKEKMKSNSFRAGYNTIEIFDLVKKYSLDEKYLDIVLQNGVNKKIFTLKGELFNLKEFEDERENDAYFKKVADIYLKENYTPPDFKTLAQQLAIKEKDVRDICTELSKTGILISISGNFYLHFEKFNALLEFLRTTFNRTNSIKISEIRDFTASSRKFIIPLMEYLDQKKYTIRTGEDRVRGTNL
jgi:selenocysteine-specific elongation factor